MADSMRAQMSPQFGSGAAMSKVSHLEESSFKSNLYLGPADQILSVIRRSGIRGLNC
jgi:hypothetical protein